MLALRRAAASSSRLPLARAFAAQASAPAAAAPASPAPSSAPSPAAPASAAPSAPAPAAPAAEAAPAPSDATRNPRPRTPGYRIERSNQGNLPVYTEYRNARSNRLTVVRKITGDVGALRNDIAQYLADGHIDPLKAPPKVYIRPTSGHVEIKGHFVEEIKGWLAMRGF